MAAVLATLIVLIAVGVWVWQYFRTLDRREVANTYFPCPYCRLKVEPGNWIAEGSRGWGHWTCVD